MVNESSLPEAEVISCVDHGPYEKMTMGVLASLAVGGDDKAYAELSRRAVADAGGNLQQKMINDDKAAG